jgi:uncharacterized protein
MQVRTIVHFEIPATDVARLSQFYRDVFGWKFDRVPMPEGEYWLISTGPQGESVGGGMYLRMGPDDRPRNYVGVDDIDEAIGTFTGAGGTQVVEKMEVPGMGWSYIGADPEGNLIAMFQPTARAPARARARPKARPKSRPRAAARRKSKGRRR